MKLNYRIIGDGRPVLIFHGLFGMSDNLQSFAKRLANSGCQVILADLRNHGHSPHDKKHDYANIASDIVELISDLGLVNPDVIGHSMGGKATLQLINDFPRLIHRAIVVDIAPYRYPVHNKEVLAALLSVDLSVVKSRSEAEKKLSESIDDVGIRQFLLKNLYWASPDQLAWRFNLEALKGCLEAVGEATWPSVQNSTPVLFVRSPLSGYIDESRFSEIKQWYPNAEFVTIQGAGHWVHADKPDELLHTIEDFLM